MINIKILTILLNTRKKVKNYLLFLLFLVYSFIVCALMGEYSYFKQSEYEMSKDGVNIFFNDYYCNYLNQKYAYEPKEKNTAFVPLDNVDLSNILCIRDKRTILNGNMVSWNNNYYQVFDKDNSIKQIYKGTEIQVFENVLTKVVRIKYYNNFYETKQIEGHRQGPAKREQMRIDNQKQLEQVLKERDERLKARANSKE